MKSVKTPYGILTEGDIYVPADGVHGNVKVVDVETFADCHDAVVLSSVTGVSYRIDWFKLMMVRFTKEEVCQAAK